VRTDTLFGKGGGSRGSSAKGTTEKRGSASFEKMKQGVTDANWERVIKLPQKGRHKLKVSQPGLKEKEKSHGRPGNAEKRTVAWGRKGGGK